MTVFIVQDLQQLYPEMQFFTELSSGCGEYLYPGVSQILAEDDIWIMHQGVLSLSKVPTSAQSHRVVVASSIYQLDSCV